jgi:flagellar hook assembly protein FlgD
MAAVLTVNAGVTVKFNSGTSLLIGSGGPGGLSVQGTSASHVTFTTSSGTPAAGQWNGIQLSPSVISTLAVTYADVLYSTNGVTYNVSGAATLSNLKVQYASATGLTILQGSPTFSAVTSINNGQWGLYASGGTVVLNSSSSISSNTGGGIKIDSPATLSLQTVSIQSNTGYGVSVDCRVNLGTVSSLTYSGNGNTNTAELRAAGNVTSNTTWANLGTPYVATGSMLVAGASTPVLTIASGVTVKFPASTELDIGYGNAGKISAVGTSSAPIVLTSSLASPTAGSWYGLRFYPQASAGSVVSYTTVKYGGNSGYQLGGVSVTAGSPSFDHDTFDTNAYAGIAVGSSTASISNSNFSNNPAGLINQTPTLAVAATFNWWGSNSGPSGSGPGSGQSVSTGATFEPWLGTAASSPQYFTAFGLANSTFNPNLSILANFNFTSTQSGNWTLKIYTSGGTLIRTISGTGTSGTPSWDGKNDGGTLQSNATYTYQIDSTAGANSAAPLRGRVTLNTAQQLTVSNLSVTPLYFSPNNDGVQDTTTISATSSFDGASWTLSIKNSSGTVVGSASGSATPNLSYTWNGGSQGDGVYTLVLTVTDGTASVQNSPTVTLDKTAPVATITSPAAGATLSNVTNSGNASFNITGSSTDTNFSGWSLDYGAGSAPTTWTNLATGSAPVSSGTFYTWPTLPITDGQYTIRLTSTDLAGNTATSSKTITVGNFNVTGGSQIMTPGTSTATYTSTVPFTLTETLIIKNGAGTAVRTLVNGSRNAGTYNDTWDGKNTSGAYVPVGTYTAVATAASGSSNMTWNPPAASFDDNTPFCGYTADWFAVGPLPNFWPFANQPLALTYSLSSNGTPRPFRTWFLFTPDWTSVRYYGSARLSMCGTTGNFCAPAGDYHGQGTFTQYYLGYDPTRTLRPDITTAVEMTFCESDTGNVIRVDGTAPAMANLAVTPFYFRPGFGVIQIGFDVATFQNAAVSVTAIVERADAAGTIKTIAANGQAAGHIALSWDGRSDSGYLLAEGPYLITITVTDPIGSTTTRQALVTIAD